MPSRRKFIIGSVGISTALAGCTGVVDRAIEETNSGSSSGTNSDSDTGSSFDNPENRRDLVETYNGAIGSANEGTEARSEGINAQSNEEHSTSVSRFESAEAAFAAAAEQFAEALTLAFQIDHQGAIDACKDGNEYGRTMESAMSIAGSSSEAAEMGAINEANKMLNDAKEMESEAQQLDILDTKEIAEMLGVERQGGF